MTVQSQLWPSLSEEKKTVLMRQEENAIMNQLILFVQRIINLRTPVEFQGGTLCICTFDGYTVCFAEIILTKCQGGGECLPPPPLKKERKMKP